VEARGRGPKGEILEGVKVRRGSSCGSPGNTGPRATDLPNASILEVGVVVSLCLGRVFEYQQRRWRNDTEGSARREAWRLSEGGILCRQKLRGVTGMKQGRKGRGGTKRQEAEKA
jgi:hypothetical protein